MQLVSMATVTFIIAGQPHIVQCDLASLPPAHHGQRGSLLGIALGAGIPVEHACGGNGACTTCHVIIRSGAHNLTEMDDTELDRLEAAWDVGPDSRLACQAIVRGDVVCEVPRYTRNYVQDGTQ